MSEYVLVVSLFSAILAFLWSTKGLGNVLVKVTLFVIVIWGLYLLFGPTMLIAQFAK